MRERVLVRPAGQNCMVFVDDSKREIRVVYEPDGTPLFCATDLAACMGYSAPTKAVTRMDEITKYRRFVPWVSAKKRGKSEAVCIDSRGVEQFLRHGVPSDELERWVLEELIPKAEAVGGRMGYDYQDPEPEPRWEASTPQRQDGSILDRLDAIILEAVMLKQEIMRRT